MDLWSFGAGVAAHAKHNYFIPTKRPIMPMPDLREEQDGELGMRFNKKMPERLGPSQYLEALTSYPMTPDAGAKDRKTNTFKKRYIGNFRRKSLNNRRQRHFSTSIEAPAPQNFYAML